MEWPITLIQREKFDYTQLRQNLFVELIGEEISRQAMEFHRRKQALNTGLEEKEGQNYPDPILKHGITDGIR